MLTEQEKLITKFFLMVLAGFLLNTGCVNTDKGSTSYLQYKPEEDSPIQFTFEYPSYLILFEDGTEMNTTKYIICEISKGQQISYQSGEEPICIFDWKICISAFKNAEVNWESERSQKVISLTEKETLLNLLEFGETSIDGVNSYRLRIEIDNQVNDKVYTEEFYFQLNNFGYEIAYTTIDNDYNDPSYGIFQDLINSIEVIEED